VKPLAITVLLGIAACGESSDRPDAAPVEEHDGAVVDASPTDTPDATPAPDAEPAPDAGPPAVVQVNCPADPAVTVVTPGFFYDPDEATIAAGDVVRFDPSTGHDVRSDTGLFTVPSGGDRCFRFDAVGTYPYHCTPHQFTGTIVVQ
jgi:plastocyanin